MWYKLSINLKFLRWTLLFLFIYHFSFADVPVSSHYNAKFLINNDIELTFQIKGLIKDCKNWGYHYGEVVDVFSKSLSNAYYNITFNAYIFSQLGTGNSNYGGAFTVSDNNPNLSNLSVFNNGKQVDYPSSDSINAPSNIWCGNVTLNEVGLTKVKIDCWGTFNGSLEAGIGNALPIELVSFTATAIENKVNLIWKTGTERDNDFFTLERSTDGKQFEVLTKIQGAGNSSELKTYQYWDEWGSNGINYYRLTQTDFNGKTTQFDPVSVDIKRASELSIYPNPSKENQGLTISSNEQLNGTCTIYNSLGQIGYQKEVVNTTKFSINENFQPGVYLLYFIPSDGSSATILKWIKE